MYKTELRSKDFLRSKRDIEDQLDFSDNTEDLRKYFGVINDYTLNELIEELERLETAKLVPLGAGFENEMSIVKNLIQNKLGLGFEIHYLIDMVTEQFELIEHSFKEVKNLKNHRHKVGEGHYSEKPAW